jgi:Flp pilus assembly protein TadG
MTFALLHLSRRFARDRRGVSAIEFAMLLPLMVALYLGTVEISQGVSIDRKITLASRTVTDLVTQTTTVDKTTLDAILEASAKVVAPYPDGPTKVTISNVKIDGNGNATVEWSRTLKGTQRSGNVTGSIPEALRVPLTNLIWGEVKYDYKPVVGYVVTGNIPLEEQIFMRPRLSDNVPCSNCN